MLPPCFVAPTATAAPTSAVRALLRATAPSASSKSVAAGLSSTRRSKKNVPTRTQLPYESRSSSSGYAGGSTLLAMRPLIPPGCDSSPRDLEPSSVWTVVPGRPLFRRDRRSWSFSPGEPRSLEVTGTRAEVGPPQTRSPKKGTVAVRPRIPRLGHLQPRPPRPLTSLTRARF